MEWTWHQSGSYEDIIYETGGGVVGRIVWSAVGGIVWSAVGGVRRLRRSALGGVRRLPRRPVGRGSAR
jgi:hypothetical protein